MLKRRSWLGLAAALSLLPAMGPSQAQAQNNVVIFAAASLKNALDEVAATWSKETGKPAPKISYAASNALAKQIEQGAPADLFISADLDWMDYCRGQEPDQARDAASTCSATASCWSRRTTRRRRVDARAGRRSRGRAGRRPARHGQCRCRAGRQIRQGGAGEARRLGRRQGQGRAGRERARRAAARRRAARRRSASSTAPTPRPSPRSRSSATFPEDSHPPIIYPVAVTKDSANPDAAAFLTYPARPTARRLPSRSRASRC